MTTTDQGASQVRMDRFDWGTVTYVLSWDIEGLDPADRVLVEDAQHYLRPRQTRGLARMAGNDLIDSEAVAVITGRSQRHSPSTKG